MLIAKILGFFVRQDLERMAQALLKNVMKVVIIMEDASLQFLREELEEEDYNIHHFQRDADLQQFQSQPHHQLHLVTHLEPQIQLKVTNGNVGVIVTIKLLQVLVLICLKTMIKLEEKIRSEP